MSYTKKNISTISLLITIFVFICFIIIYFQIPFFKSSAYYPNTLYSKIIPIEEQNQKIQTITNTLKQEKEQNQDVCEEKSESKKQDKNEEVRKEIITQREVVKQNKNIKWRIQIPKIGLDAHIKEGTTQSVLLEAVGHFEESDTWDGNVALAAHNRGYQCNFFQKIKKLKIGDEIIYCSKKGKRIYQVQTNKVIKETDWSYVEQTKDNRITLITCEENRPEYRRCVQAVLVTKELKYQ